MGWWNVKRLSMNDNGAVDRFYVLRGRPHECAYCGDTADTTDHTIPKSVVKQNRMGFVGFEILRVYACRECNGILGTNLFDSFSERKAFVAEKLRKKYRRYLAATAWEPEEIEELGPGLRPKITVAAAIGKFAERRVKFASFPVTPGVPDNLLTRRTVTDWQDLESA